MAENKTNPEVELDTDGVNEETVIVDAPEVSTEAFEKKQEVDLGYIDVSGGKSAKELLDETKEEKTEPKFEQKEEDEDPSLQDYSEKVQKRIKRLTFQAKEAERRERAAIEYAKGLKNQFENSEKKFQETDTNYLKEYSARVDSEREKAMRQILNRSSVSFRTFSQSTTVTTQTLSGRTKSGRWRSRHRSCRR